VKAQELVSKRVDSEDTGRGLKIVGFGVFREGMSWLVT